MKRLKLVLIYLAVCVAATAQVLAIAVQNTESDIHTQRQRVIAAALKSTAPRPAPEQIAALPEPVQRFVRFTFPKGIPDIRYVELDMQGMFRRPKTTAFAPAQVHQTLAAHASSLVFDATTSVVPGIWARAYDGYVDGDMVMKAKMLSAVALVDEHASPLLNRISLRRWLLESSYFPVALLPGGKVQWQAVDTHHARAVVTADGLSASLLATFDDAGRLLQWDAEEDGDLNTPYHGSGEHAERSNYQLVQGMMIPMQFRVARAAKGRIDPFWEGRVTRIKVTGSTANFPASELPRHPALQD